MMVSRIVCLTAFLLVLTAGNTRAQGKAAGTDSAWTNRHLQRNLILGNVAMLSASYVYFSNTWGAPVGKFHFKNDFHDNLALTDEVSHMFAAYRLAEGFNWLFRLLRMQPDKREKYAILESGLITTLIEFPLDAYNPHQGLGLSDLAFDWAGLGFYWLHQRGLQTFDIKFSLKRSPFDFDHKLLASENEEFSNFIWWANWKPKYVWLGLGYSTNHDAGDVASEYFLGVGTTLYDLIALINRPVADRMKALDAYFIHVKLKL